MPPSSNGAQAPAKTPFEPLQRRLQVQLINRLLETKDPGHFPSLCAENMVLRGLALQVLLDKSTPHTLYRWLALAAVALLYALRVYYLQG